MSILNEITIDFDLDCKLVCGTPAKLKLRNKTLTGINKNLDNIDNIPGLMLAKKKKKKPLDEIKLEEQNIQIEEIKVEESETKEEQVPVIEQITTIEPIIEGELTGDKKLNVSEENFARLENKTNEMMSELSIEAQNIDEQPAMEEVQVDEIPTIEEPEFKLEQGEVGLVTNVENVQEEISERKVPTLDEVREKMIANDPQQEAVNNETSAIEKADADEAFMENTKLNEELRELKRQEKSSRQRLEDSKIQFENATNLNNELNSTYEQTKEQADIAEKSFHDAIAKQKAVLVEMRDHLKEQDQRNNQETQELNSKTTKLQEENSKKEGQIQTESERLTKYRNLLASLESMEFEDQEEQEMSYARVA